MSNCSHSYPVNNAIRKYDNHPRLKKTSETIIVASTFHFSGVDKADVIWSIDSLNSSKVWTFKNIPIKCLKVTSNIAYIVYIYIYIYTRFFRLSGIQSLS